MPLSHVNQNNLARLPHSEAYKVTCFPGQHYDLPGGSFAIVRREPLGVVAAVGAWNYPFQVMSWKMAPALVCGNTFVFKPSPLTPFSAIMLAEACRDAGIPEGVVNVVQVGCHSAFSGCCQHLLGKVPTQRGTEYEQRLPVVNSVITCTYWTECK